MKIKLFYIFTCLELDFHFIPKHTFLVSKMKSRNKLFAPQFPYKEEQLLNDKQYLGKGKYGEIFSIADDSKVVKIISKRKIIAENMINQLKRERENHSRCSHHKNILTLLGAWQDDVNVYLTFPKCEISLFNLVRIGSDSALAEKLASEALKAVLAQMSSAIRQIHDLLIIHRDIKLENILVSNDGALLISDFGLSGNAAGGGMTSVCGTLAYMAPEMTEERKYDFGVDWWSFGVALYRLTYGEMPFKRAENHKLMRLNIKTDELRTDSGDAIINESIISCLEVNSSERRSKVNSFLERNKSLLNNAKYCSSDIISLIKSNE